MKKFCRINSSINRALIKKIVLAIFMIGTIHGYGQNMLKNSGFEDVSEKPKQGCFRFFSQDWRIILNSGAAKCGAEISDDAYEGKHSLKFTTKVPNAFVAADQRIKASPGQDVRASVYFKGTKGAKVYMRFWGIDANGKVMKKHIIMPGARATAKWKQLKCRFKVPDGATGIIASVNTLVNKKIVEVYFDKFELSIASGTMLENKKLRVKINPMVGGCIDSFMLKDAGFDFTMPNLPNSTGGMALDIIGSTYPGFVRNENYRAEILEPYHKIRVTRIINAEKLKGLKIAKIFILPKDSATLIIQVQLKNTGGKELKFEYRTQNCIKPANGTLSWPTADWVQAFYKTPKAIIGMNSVGTDNLGFGWCAKTYDKPQDVLLCKFQKVQVEKAYSYLSENLDTLEWYYRQVKLAPGESWETEYTIAVQPATGKLYRGGIKGNIVYVKGIKMPKPHTKAKLPKIMQGFFPFGGQSAPLVTSLSAGSKSKQFRYTYTRAMRDLGYNYFNLFYSSRMLQKGYMPQFYDKDGTFILGELARKYDMMLAGNTHLYGRNDIDTKDYSPVLQKKLDFYYTPQVRKLLKDYHDRILCYFTGDETLPQNVSAMLMAHDALKKIDSDRVAFPYMNINARGNIPYLPVFLGDWYPIKRDGYGSRNPWSTAKVVEDSVKLAGDTPVLFMPQAFGYNHHLQNYALPTAAEERLMLYLAVANGAKGIVFHALINNGVPWRMKYGYPFSIYGNAGQRTEAWYAIRDCGKQLTAIGPCLYYTNPEWKFAGVKITSENFKNAKGFYDGPAITLNSLKQLNDGGRFLVVINQNDNAEQTGEITFDKKFNGMELYDLTAMKKIDSLNSLQIKLPPGDARFYYLGSQVDAEKVFAEVCGNRYQRELVRYQIDAENATKNSVAIKTATTLADQAKRDYSAKQSEAAYRTILLAQDELKVIVGKTEFGQTLQALSKSRKLLDKIDFMLRTHMDLVMPLAIRKKAPRYRIYNNTDNPEMQQLINAIAKDFFDFWKLDRETRQGKFNQNRSLIEQLLIRIPKDVKAMETYLKTNEHKIKVDNPYK